MFASCFIFRKLVIMSLMKIGFGLAVYRLLGIYLVMGRY